MITLEKVRLVNWHNFNDVIIDIGNRCLFAGDNGSGKSTIIDAIQYAMAAYLHKARFNSAAGEQRRGGRDLQGYVRCKLGSDTTEYMRGDTVAHVILEFSCGTAVNTAASFSAGVCVEAYTNDKLTEHFWIGDGIPAATVLIQSENKTPLQARQFKDRIEARDAIVYESKKLYLRDFTGKLGVWKRYSDYNPYLEAFTRSVSFTPLVSVDRFVCDYILEDRPVEISTMKDNLESYKEAERQAHGTVMRIDALKKIMDKAADWRNYKSLIIKQEYLKLCIELNITKAEQERETQKLENSEKKVAFFEAEISKTGKQKSDWEGTRAETLVSLAANDAHNLYRRACERIERIKTELAEHQKKKDDYETYKAQCEAMLGHPLEDDPEKNTEAIETAEQEARKEKEAAANEKNSAAAELIEVQTELIDLENGILHFPHEHTALCEALRNAGIDAHFLAETAEITDMAWADAIEGWLNTRRFALLVEPPLFQRALEVYNSLPRTVAGAFLPNLEKMRGASPQKNTLATLVKTESPYSRIYLDYVLGDVVCADIATLKQFKMAVTKECMTYGNHTASRIREEVYKRRYLGQAARLERRAFLTAEQTRLKNVRNEAASREEKAAQREEIYHRVAKTIIKLKYLFPALALCDKLNADLIEAETERSAIDTQSFRDLEEKVQRLNADIKKAEDSLTKYNIEFGRVSQIVESSRVTLTSLTAVLGEKKTDIQTFAETYEDVIASCENYADEKLKEHSLTDLQLSYESTLKGFISRAENLRKEYQNLVLVYEREFNAMLQLEPENSDEAGSILRRLEMSELPAYREKIAQARTDAEREFKEHFISKLNERIEEARMSFREINDILKNLSFGRDQYRFSLEERSDRRGQIEIIRKAAAIPTEDESLFAQFTDPAELKAVEDLFVRILNSNLDSPELRSLCDYRTYFTYDIKIKETDVFVLKDKPVELSLSKVLREKSGGETQTPYYVAIAASFYRFYKDRPEETVRLVMFDEAFNRMDDERIGKILSFFKDLNIQIISAVPTEKIESIAPYMDRTNLFIRHGFAARVRDFHVDTMGN